PGDHPIAARMERVALPLFEPVHQVARLRRLAAQLFELIQEPLGRGRGEAIQVVLAAGGDAEVGHEDGLWGWGGLRLSVPDAGTDCPELAPAPREYIPMIAREARAQLGAGELPLRGAL